MTSLSAGIHGIYFQYLWPNATWWNDVSLITSLSCIVIFAALFTRSFLSLGHQRPSLAKLCVFTVYGGVACIAAAFLLPYRYGIFMTIAWAIFGILAAFSIGIIRWRDGYELAKIYNAAWSCMLLGGLILALNKFDLLPRNVFTENAARIGATLEVLLLSLALGYRMNNDRRLREEAQRESIEAQSKAVDSLRQYQTLYHNSAQGLFTVDCAGNLLKANPSFYRLIQKNIQGDSPGQTNICQFFPDVAKVLSGDLANQFKNGHRVKGVITSKQECWAVMTLTPGVGNQGEREYWEGSALDITTSIEKEEAERKQRSAEASAQAKSLFLANMSHEIRTPLNGVLGMAQLMWDTDLDSQQKKYLNTIFSSANTLLDIINDILDYSKIEENKLDVERINVDLLGVVDECVSSVAYRVNEKALSLYVDYDPEMPKYIKSDPLRIRQILLNLLSNAVKFTEQGKIVINISAGQGSQVKFSVVDTGIGINREQENRLFKSFSRAESSTSRKYGGTGLGLAISKRLSLLLGGAIGACAAPVKGAEFWFMIKDYTERDQLELEKKVPEELSQYVLMFALQDSFFIETTARYSISKSGSMQVFQEVEELVSLYESADWPDQYCLIIDEQMFRLFTDCIADTHNLLFESMLILVASGASGRYKNWVPVDRILEMPLSSGHLYAAILSMLSPKPARLTNENPNIELHNYTFIVAEDNLVNQMVIEGILKKSGARVLIANNGNVAIKLFREHGDDVAAILMDIEMPECDGYEATKTIRAIEQDKQSGSIPIIGLSAHVLKEFKEKSFTVGMDGFVCKPLSIDDLANELRRLRIAC